MGNVLLDSYIEEESGQDNFRKALEDISGRTHSIKATADEITFLSLCRVANENRKPDQAYFWILTKDALASFEEYGDQFQVGAFPIKEIGEELYNEMVETSGMMLVISGKRYLLAGDAFLTLCQQAKFGGKYALKANIYRDMCLAEAFYSNVKKVTAIYRECEGVNKIFAVFADGHTHIGQQVLLHSYDSMETEMSLMQAGYIATDIRYTITNTVTDVLVRFGTSDCGPGLYLSDSDTGYSSIAVRPIYFFGENYVVLNEHIAKHSGRLSEEEVKAMFDMAITDLSSGQFEKALKKIQKKAITPEKIEKVISLMLSEADSVSKMEMLTEQLKQKAPENGYELCRMVYDFLPEIRYEDRGRNNKLYRVCGKLPFSI